MTVNRKAITAAKLYLEMRGFSIRELFWRLGSRKIDIVATKQNQLWFIAVTSEKSDAIGADHAVMSVSRQKALVDAASAWVDENKSTARYTIASIEVDSVTRAILNFTEDLV